MIQWGQAKGKGGRREGKMSEVERNEGMKEERREGGRAIPVSIHLSSWQVVQYKFRITAQDNQ